MFGYLEAPYTVLRQASLEVRNRTQHFEVRQASAPAQQKPYIALFCSDKQGRPVFDYLLLYQDQAQLEADWQRLVSEAAVGLRELMWDELIVEHATGYNRQGGVSMY